MCVSVGASVGVGEGKGAGVEVGTHQGCSVQGLVKILGLQTFKHFKESEVPLKFGWSLFNFTVFKPSSVKTTVGLCSVYS